MTAASSAEAPIVGGYRLLAKIGEGGMGVVHLAQGSSGRRVALKVLRPHVVGDDEARERLAREVASLRRVSSPRVAEVIDADPWGETPFVATRYVPGLSLHQHVKEQGPVIGDDLWWLASCLAEAMASVHAVGVLHRDIKPSNVLLEGRSPVLIDFGLARVAEDARLTHTGWLLGTPGYLAPEILYGEEATTAADVHGWAATLVFAATGRSPYGTGPAMAIMDRCRRGEHDLSGVPDDLLPILTRGLALDPEDRPTTGHLAAYLRPRTPAVTAVPTPARPSPVGPPAAQETLPWVLAANPGRPEDATASVREVVTPRSSVPATTRLDPTGRARVVEPATHVMSPAAARLPEPATSRIPDPTTPYTTVARWPEHTAASGPPVVSGPLSHPVPARSPYEQPPGPAWAPDEGLDRPPLLPPQPVVRRTFGARVQRALIMGSAWATVALGTAVAPHVAVLVLTVLVLLVRTWSWSTQAGRERRHLRGRSRWYDSTLTLIGTPWYLLVAAGGTILLLGWSLAVTALAGVGALLLGVRAPELLVGAGALMALLVWWGPGAARLRQPVRRVSAALTRRTWIGWLAVAAVIAPVLALGMVVGSGEPSWQPSLGPILSDLGVLRRLVGGL